MYIVAADIAKRRDFFTLMITQESPVIIDERIITYLDIVHLYNVTGLTYQEMANLTARTMNDTRLTHNADLIVDSTGVGEAAVEMMRALRLTPIPILFTGGDTARPIYNDFGSVFATGHGGQSLRPLQTLKEYHVPKKDLVAAGEVMLQQQRVRVASGIPSGDRLREQLEGFKGKVNEKNHRTFNAETEELHDDIVVDFLMTAWWYLNKKTPTVPDSRLPKKEPTKDWDPLTEWARRGD